MLSVPTDFGARLNYEMFQVPSLCCENINLFIWNSFYNWTADLIAYVSVHVAA